MSLSNRTLESAETGAPVCDRLWTIQAPKADSMSALQHSKRRDGLARFVFASIKAVQLFNSRAMMMTGTFPDHFWSKEQRMNTVVSAIDGNSRTA